MDLEEGVCEVLAFGPKFGIKVNHDKFKSKQGRNPRTACRTVCGDEECKQQYVHCWGSKVKPYLRILDAEEGGHGNCCPCGMTQEHALAQQIIKSTLDSGNQIEIRRWCMSCDHHSWNHIVRLRPNEECETEVKFKYNNKGSGMRSADIGIKAKAAHAGTTPHTIIEVLHSSKTEENTRPSECTWYEVLAESVIEGVSHEGDTQIKLDCQRTRTRRCDKCEWRQYRRKLFTELGRIKKEEENRRLAEEREAVNARTKEIVEARQAAIQATREVKRKANLKRKAKAREEFALRNKRRFELAQLRATQVQYDIDHATALREASIQDSEKYTDQEIEDAVRRHWLHLKPLGPCMPPDKDYKKIDLAIKRMQMEEEDGVDPTIYSDHEYT